MKSLVRGISLCLLAAAFAAACAVRNAPAPGVLDTSGWELLGRRQVNFSFDRDAVAVTAARGAFKRLMIVVRDRALEMYDLQITFGSGEPFSPATRLVFGQDSRSRVIDLPGKRRVVKRVDFAYRSLGVGWDRADIEIWGR